MVLACALASALFAVRMIRVSNDSMWYALVADQVRQGHGLRLPAFYLSETPDEFGTVPFTYQPPLLPVVLAALGGISADRMWPWIVLNVLAHMATAAVVVAIARRFGGWSVGLVAGLIVCISYPQLHVVRALWSEPLFIALFMLAVWSLVVSRTADRSGRWQLGSGIAAAAALLTRYAGVAIVPVCFYEAAVTWRREGIRAGMATLARTALPSVLCLAFLFGRNALLTGYIRGFGQASPDRSLLGMFVGTGRMMLGQFGLWGLDARTVLRAALGVALLIGPTAALFFTARGRNKVGDYVRGGLDLVAVFAAAYVGLITYAMMGGLPDFELRFGAPIAPLVVIGFVVVLANGWGVLSATTGRAAARVALAASLILVGLHAVTQSVTRVHAARGVSFNIVRTESFRWLTEHAAPGEPVATNAAVKVAFLGKRPALRPQVSYGYTEYLQLQMNGVPASWRHWAVPEDMILAIAQKMEQVGARYLVLFCGEEGLPASHWGEQVAALSRGEDVPTMFTEVRRYPDGVIYALTSPGSAPRPCASLCVP